MKIKMLAMDVDGTLTDGHIYVGANGEMMKAFDVKDGYAIAHMLPKLGITPVIISGRTSAIVKYRAGELGIQELYQGVMDKLTKLKEVAAAHGLSAEEVAYAGDDLNDLDCICWCGFTACPRDAVDEVKEAVSYVCERNGGFGAVREMIERIKKLD